MPLKDYNKKRNFNKTPEPKGKLSRLHKNLFIIQKHAASHLHYDFRLELNGVLLSWAIPKGPCLDPTVRRLAMQVEDHPVQYGHFEGVIPKGEYGGGTVMLWDKGIWISEDEDPVKAYRYGHLHFILKAAKLNGRFNLFRLKKNDGKEKSWFLVKANDEYACPLSRYDITQAKPLSVLTNQDMDEIALNYDKVWTKNGLQKTKSKKRLTLSKPHLRSIKINLSSSPMPKTVFPELALLVNHPPTGDAWLHELKFDGYRMITFKKNKDIRIMSRNNKDWTKYFLKVADEIAKLSIKNLILDGEIVLLDENKKANFQLLQNSLKNTKEMPFIYYIFDMIYYDKYNLTALPLIERKHILNKIITSTTAPILRFSAHVIGSGDELFHKACEMKLEGIVSKAVDSIYEEKRTKAWLKVKCSKRQEFVIGGYSEPKGSRSYFGSLYLGYYNKDKLIYCGNVGTGFNQHLLKEIFTQLKKYKTKNNPFNSRPPGVTKAAWVKPVLAAEVEFTEWTKEGILRHPSFKGLRSDKPAKEIIREKELNVEKLKKTVKHAPVMKNVKLSFPLTHPTKILYPEDKITKAHVAHYYESVQKWILPYISNRPLTLVRCPDNYKKCFYQKNINKTMPKSLFSIKVKGKEETNFFIYIKNSEGLMSLAQMGVLEIHPWGSCVQNLEHPDIMIFDIDPAPEIEWEQVVETAFILKQHLAELKLQSFIKTTGGKGLHVVVPILPKYNWDEIKQFSHVFVSLIVKKYPGKYISEMSKIKRKGKIFIDYMRNQRGATAIAPYSTRARIHAPISTPLNWTELTSHFQDTFYTIFTLKARLNNLKNDPWKDFFKVKQSLNLNKI